MLLFGSLHTTLSVVFCKPHAWWDLSIALGILPVLISLVFKVPSVLEPMILSLSLEMLVDRHMVQDVCQHAQQHKFGQATELLQSVQAQARRRHAKCAVGLDKRSVQREARPPPPPPRLGD